MGRAEVSEQPRFVDLADVMASAVVGAEMTPGFHALRSWIVMHDKGCRPPAKGFKHWNKTVR